MEQVHEALTAFNSWLTPMGLETRDLLITVLLGMLAFLVQAFLRAQDQRRQARAELFALVSQIGNLVGEVALKRAEAYTQERLLAYQSAIAPLTKQITLLTQRVVLLDEESPVTLSYADLATIAEALALTENPVAAQLYWRRALAKSDGGIETMISYWDYLYGAGKIDEARAAMDAYRAKLRGGPASADELGRSHYAQATLELRNGDPAVAGAAFEAASAAFAAIPAPSLRTYRLRSVEEAVATHRAHG